MTATATMTGLLMDDGVSVAHVLLATTPSVLAQWTARKQTAASGSNWPTRARGVMVGKRREET